MEREGKGSTILKKRPPASDGWLRACYHTLAVVGMDTNSLRGTCGLSVGVVGDQRPLGAVSCTFIK